MREAPSTNLWRNGDDTGVDKVANLIISSRVVLVHLIAPTWKIAPTPSSRWDRASVVEYVTQPTEDGAKLNVITFHGLTNMFRLQLVHGRFAFSVGIGRQRLG